MKMTYHLQKALNTSITEFLKKKRSPLLDIETKSFCMSLPIEWYHGLKHLAERIGQREGMRLTVQDVLRLAIVRGFLSHQIRRVPKYKTYKPKRIAKLPDGDF